VQKHIKYINTQSVSFLFIKHKDDYKIFIMESLLSIITPKSFYNLPTVNNTVTHLIVTPSWINYIFPLAVPNISSYAIRYLWKVYCYELDLFKIITTSLLENRMMVDLMLQKYEFSFLHHDDYIRYREIINYIFFMAFELSTGWLGNIDIDNFEEVLRFQSGVVRLYDPKLYPDWVKILFGKIYVFVTGAIKFILSGGESNPGPVFSKIQETVTTGISNLLERTVYKLFKKFIKPQINRFKKQINYTKELSWMSVHILRMYTTICDTLFYLVTNAQTSPLDITARLATVLLNLYETHTKFFPKGNFVLNATGQGGPMETVFMAGILAQGMPRFISNILKEIPKYTNAKILDDASWFYDIFGFLISLPRRIIQCYTPTSETAKSMYDKVIELLVKIETYLPFSNLSTVSKELKSMIEEINDAPIKAMSAEKQEEICALDKKRKEIEFSYACNKKVFPGWYTNISDEFDRLVIRILKYKSDLRVEPVCIVLNGPKGTGKSVAMNLIIQMYKAAGMRVFIDNISASLENKKFYDTYDNEEMYGVDDIGAKSLSQWSEVVNMVSSTKYPLEAANLKNKNTKFFNSLLMLLSTNSIPDNFTSKDGVADKEAFYRRIIEFNFGQVTFDGEYHGEMTIRKYNDTLGVKAFTVRQRIPLNGPLPMDILDEFIHGELLRKKQIYETNVATGSNFKGRAFPTTVKAQGLHDTVRRMFADYLTRMPGLNAFAGLVTDWMMQLADEFEEHPKYKLYIVTSLCVSIAVFFGVYYFLKAKTKHDEKVEEIHKHYKSDRTKKATVVGMMTQGYVNIHNEVVAATPQLSKFQTNVAISFIHYVNIQGKSSKVKCRTVYSVDKILTAAHLLHDRDPRYPMYITSYVGEQIIYDYMEIKELVTDDSEDWTILTLPATAPKLMPKIKIPTEETSVKLHLAVGNQTVVDLGEDIRQYLFKNVYKYKTFLGSLDHRDIMYNMEEDGLCGSPLITRDGRMLGLHVAAVEYEQGEQVYVKGVSKLWSSKASELILGIMSLSTDDKCNLDFEIKQRSLSGVYLNREDKCYGIDGTRYVESPIHGKFPIWRKPALNLPEEKKNFKDLTEMMMKPVGDVNLVGADFAKDILNEKLPKQTFENFTEEEVVKGNGILNRINPDTSSGNFVKMDKRDALDYETGQISEPMKNRCADYIHKIANGEYKFEDSATVAAKDELKDVQDITNPESMPKKIRLFINCHLISTLIFRFFFGNLMSHIMQDRMRYGIMIGLNPLSSQWSTLVARLTNLTSRVFDGDYAAYDKNMHPVFQRILNKWLTQRVEINPRKFNKVFGTKINETQIRLVLDQILEYIISTPVISKNKTFLTTHGLPSGTALTAFYNSCINLLYTAYIYRMKAPLEYCKVHSYLENTFLCFYGDDIIGSIHPRIQHFYNPKVFSEVMIAMGLDFTPANKNEQWNDNNQFKPIEQCTFLRRGFYFHPKMKQYVAPLDITSREGTLNYVTDALRDVELIQQKFYNFQREAFLCPGNYYANGMNTIQEALSEKDIVVTPLSEEYLTQLYHKGDYGDHLTLN
jgi:energy-converting hydrogenase Eha subunit A